MYIKAFLLGHVALIYQSNGRLGRVLSPLHTRKRRFVFNPGLIVSLSRFAGLPSFSSGTLPNVIAPVRTPAQPVSQELVSRRPAVTQAPSSVTRTLEMWKLNLYQMFPRMAEQNNPRRQKQL